MRSIRDLPEHIHWWGCCAKPWASAPQWNGSCGQITSRDGHDIVVDQAFGLVWYRMIFAHQTFDECAADEVAAAFETQLVSLLDAPS
ncbi:hypothetical protein [Mycobacterium florentinum]|uniref:hypothetical protein n=1 Tax=Mycobacterium florentinum TaxID=292462 RepID=UPI0013D74B42|nr:hypothetical protein [Mycobacterium florentinum]MCV7411084.1 hypothetical protein [Mycobacterium florentinum]